MNDTSIKDIVKDAFNKLIGRDRDKPKPEPSEPQVVLPWGSWDDVTFVGMPDIRSLPITMRIGAVTCGRSQTSWPVTKWPEPDWPVIRGIKNNPNACLCMSFEYVFDHKWYILPTEWLKPRTPVQSTSHIMRSDRGNKKIWKDPFRDYEIPTGTRCAILVLDKWPGKAGTATQRSNVSEVFTR